MQRKAPQQIIFLLFLIMLNSSCSTRITKIPESEKLLTIVNPTYKFTDNVSFSISNTAAFPLLVESTTYYYIEQFNDEYNQWDKIPYQPCKCGTPCMPPSSKRLDSGEQLSVAWNRESVSCPSKEKVTETLTKYQKKGIYRMTFVYYPIIDNKKSGRKELKYEFKLK